VGLSAAIADVLAVFRNVELSDGSKLRATDNAGQVTPPCVWLPPPTIEFNYAKHVLNVTWTAYLVAPASSSLSMPTTLSQLVDIVAGLFPFTTGDPQLLTLQGAGQPVPSYELKWLARITIGD
jgi:hypothetical protein